MSNTRSNFGFSGNQGQVTKKNKYNLTVFLSCSKVICPTNERGFWKINRLVQLGYLKKIVGKVPSHEPPHDKTNKMTVRPGKTQISLGICPVFAGCSVDSLGPELSSCWQRRLWSDWADAQTDWSLHPVWSVFAGRTLILLVLSWGGSH